MTVHPLGWNSHLDSIRTADGSVAGDTPCRYGGSRLTALRLFLWTATGGRCATCARPVTLDPGPHVMVLAHVVPACGKPAGYKEGNLYPSCVPDNSGMRNTEPNVAAMPLGHLIPREWPSFPATGTGSRHAEAIAARARMIARGILPPD